MYRKLTSFGQRSRGSENLDTCIYLFLLSGIRDRTVNDKIMIRSLAAAIPNPCKFGLKLEQKIGRKVSTHSFPRLSFTTFRITNLFMACAMVGGIGCTRGWF